MRSIGLGVTVCALVLSACRKSEPGAKAAEGSSSAPAAAPGVTPAPTMPPLVTETLAFDGQDVTFTHSAFDLGRIQDVIDNDPLSMARTTNANPAILELSFSKPRSLKGVELTTASMEMGVTCVATLAGGGEKTYSKEFKDLKPDPSVKVDFAGLTGKVEKLRIEVNGRNVGDGHIHLRTLRLY